MTPPSKSTLKKSVPKAKRVASKASPAPESKDLSCASVKTIVCAPVPPAAEKSPAAISQAQRVTFSVRADPGSKVFVAGDFNKWNATANPLTDPARTGDFSAVVMLAPGNYEYKFVINGTWCVDPECPEWVQNGLGTLNSVCKV